METSGTAVHRAPWNKGKIVGQKAPFKLKDIWSLRVRLQLENRVRELVGPAKWRNPLSRLTFKGESALSFLPERYPIRLSF